MKALTLVACLCFTWQLGPRIVAQQPVQHFDTVSIRPMNPGDESFGYNPNPNIFQAKGVDLSFLVQLAYRANAKDIIEIPAALRSLKFDIQAKADVDPASPSAKLHYSSEEGQKLFEARLQSLLEERFQLRLHHATATRSVLNLEATKHPHLLPVVRQNSMQTYGDGYLKFDSIDMEGLASALSDKLETNVLDHTGLKGDFALEVRWDVHDRTEALTYPFSIVNDSLNDQLGLKLVPAKANVPILVIDSATLPSAN